MRTYRTVPALVAAVLFLVAGSVALNALLPGAVSVSPEQEVWLVYFALMRGGQPPEALTGDDLRRLLGALDPAAEAVAERVSVLSYQRSSGGFLLEVEHRGDGRRYRITVDGVT